MDLIKEGGSWLRHATFWPVGEGGNSNRHSECPSSALLPTVDAENMKTFELDFSRILLSFRGTIACSMIQIFQLSLFESHYHSDNSENFCNVGSTNFEVLPTRTPSYSQR